ncbi:conjugal transfer protein TrbH (plasmid) [Aminobacter sp. MSH1]|uniref:conjugal transfer protein TrbH n=1 Tax=Aminobacter sp. MSH1 TaxID=374606 RepID=UPI0009DC4EE4|nr:conjugal transfer protein TrbH [Aminobacter sp. MSH1]ARD70046.1 conjugal transfer protein TrbH [Aminobacter sp. MSH1]
MGKFFFPVRLALIGLCFAALAGCQTLGTRGLVESAITTELTPQAATTIAEDMVGRLAEVLAPGSTTIAFTAKDAVFAGALETTLRNWGYGVVIGGKTADPSQEPLAYVIDTLDGNVLVRIATPKVELTRVYALSAEGATPASPLSAMSREPVPAS